MPASYQALRDSGFLIHEEDLKHPLGEIFGYAFVSGKIQNISGKVAIAVDNAPVFYVFDHNANGSVRYLLDIRYVSTSGEVVTSHGLDRLYQITHRCGRL